MRADSCAGGEGRRAEGRSDRRRRPLAVRGLPRRTGRGDAGGDPATGLIGGPGVDVARNDTEIEGVPWLAELRRVRRRDLALRSYGGPGDRSVSVVLHGALPEREHRLCGAEMHADRSDQAHHYPGAGAESWECRMHSRHRSRTRPKARFPCLPSRHRVRAFNGGVIGRVLGVDAGCAGVLAASSPSPGGRHPVFHFGAGIVASTSKRARSARYTSRANSMHLPRASWLHRVSRSPAEAGRTRR